MKLVKAMMKSLGVIFTSIAVNFVMIVSPKWLGCTYAAVLIVGCSVYLTYLFYKR